MMELIILNRRLLPSRRPTTLPDVSCCGVLCCIHKLCNFPIKPAHSINILKQSDQIWRVAGTATGKTCIDTEGGFLRKQSNLPPHSYLLCTLLLFDAGEDLIPVP